MRGFYRARTRASIRSTCAIGVCGKTPCPRLKMKGRAAAAQHQWVEISLHRQARVNLVAHKDGIDRPIEADGVYRNVLYVAQECGAGTARKRDHFCIRHLAAHLCN